MKFIDFFAGIGGFRRGMELAGHECVGFCEYDKFATASYTSMHLISEEQREYLNTLALKKRQKEILKEEYRNGEWYACDIKNVTIEDIPKSDCWCFGAPCQDFSIAGRRAGLNGERSSLVREIFRLLEEQEEKTRPQWLIYENVKGMFFSNRGLDYLSILVELDRLGYDAEWQNINSAWFVPQNRERIYTIGHLRRYGRRKIFPITGANGENSIQVIAHRDGYRRNLQTFSPEGITETLSTGQGGGREHHVALPMFCDMNKGAGMNSRNNARALQARYNKGINNRSGEISGVVIPVLTPDRIEKRQNGRRFKEDGEPMFTLTSQDRHGVALKVSGNLTVYAVWYEKYHCYITIRKLTPKECFRLQGWTDDYFEKAQFVNSDSQLYKQAGNGVTVDVVLTIGLKIKTGF